MGGFTEEFLGHLDGLDSVRVWDRRCVVDALAHLLRDVVTGPCALVRCRNPVVAYVGGWDVYPKGICAAHRLEVERVGYTTREVTITTATRNT